MKKKILLVFDKGLGHGGVQSVLMSIVRNLSYEYTFDIIVNTSLKLFFNDEFLSYGGNIFQISYYEGKSSFLKRADFYVRGLYLYRKCLKTIHENMPYIAIHCHNAYESGPVLMAAAKLGIPIRMLHSHAIPTPDPFIRKLLTDIYKQMYLKNGNYFIGCSEEACVSMFGEVVPYKIISNSYDNKKFNGMLHLNSTSNSQLRLIQVGRFDRIKNQSFSLTLLKKILDKMPNATLDLVGSDGGDAEKTLITEAKNLSIEKHVSIYRTDADIPLLLRRANAFILPSIVEGFGIALVEAQAMGLRCYASDSVPRTTDCGGCMYISLADIDRWVDVILNDYFLYKGKHEIYDCGEYSEENIMNHYLKIYGGR